jgi:hypothetical protein
MTVTDPPFAYPMRMNPSRSNHARRPRRVWRVEPAMYLEWIASASSRVIASARRNRRISGAAAENMVASPELQNKLCNMFVRPVTSQTPLCALSFNYLGTRQ